MRRLTWFLAGFAVALVGGGYAKRRVRAAATSFAPTRVAQRVKHRVTDAVAEGRAAMHERESALKTNA
jgi:hypothetical protein